jgi:selenocysteine-specific elongation factor
VKRLVIGVIGHVDHGKTALVGALTGMATDRLPEEQARGISIALGFAHFSPAPGLVVDLIDMPGHERFVRTMVAGASGIDAVLLVVAANEGIKPQSVEHAEIAALLGMTRAVVAVTKADLAPPDEAALIGEEAADLLRGLGMTVPPPILTSAAQPAGIAELGAALAGLAGDERAADGQAWLPIDRAFTVTGHGTVVTGTLRGAGIAVGDMLDLLPRGRRVRVRGVQVHGLAVEQALPGQRAAVNLRGVDAGEVARGMALAAPGALLPGAWITLSLRSAAGAPPLKNGAMVRALGGTSEADARLRLLDRDVLQPGTSALAQLRMAAGTALPVGAHVILRLPAPLGTVAGGRVLEVTDTRLKRHHPPVLARLAGLRDAGPDAIIAAEVARAGSKGTTLAQLARLTALAEWRVAELLRPLPVEVQRSGEVLPKAELERRRQRLAPRPDPARAASETELANAVAEQMRLAGLTPPTLKELITGAALHRAAERLLKDGVLIRATDRDKGKELFFHRDAIAHARAVLAPLLAADREGLLVSEITAALGVSRKFCMPLLDHLDTTRFTRRQGDRRVLHGSAAAEP